MNKLEEARSIINSVDKEMAELFEKRMKAVEQVVAYKIENGLDVLDVSREKEVIERNLKYITDEKLKKYYEKYLVNLMDVSKDYQKDIMSNT